MVACIICAQKLAELFVQINSPKGQGLVVAWSVDVLQSHRTVLNAILPKLCIATSLINEQSTLESSRLDCLHPFGIKSAKQAKCCPVCRCGRLHRLFDKAT